MREQFGLLHKVNSLKHICMVYRPLCLSTGLFLDYEFNLDSLEVEF